MNPRKSTHSDELAPPDAVIMLGEALGDSVGEVGDIVGGDCCAARWARKHPTTMMKCHIETYYNECGSQGRLLNGLTKRHYVCWSTRTKYSTKAKVLCYIPWGILCFTILLLLMLLSRITFFPFFMDV